jgi:proline dehydrogenase
MSIMRNLLLAGSRSVWLRDRAMRTSVVRRSVSRFMPGEAMSDALDACVKLGQAGPGTLVTHLGENLTSVSEADDVVRNYLDLMARISERGCDTQVSLKLTQLGLDLDQELCFRGLMTLVDHAGQAGNFVWIDMESSSYVDATLGLFRRARERSAHVGICLQSYLRRTPADLEALIPLGAAIRMVKGAYREPPEVAFPRKADVDEAFFSLSSRLLSVDAVHAGARLSIGTHDPSLVSRLQDVARERSLPRESFEFSMLYGIQRPLQQKLTAQGWILRVLISYGTSWFPWYMRRLAERPANVWFVAKGLFRG